MKQARCNVWLKTDLGETLGALQYDQLSIVRDVESYDTLVITANPKQALLNGVAYDSFVDRRITIERSGVNVPYMRTEGEYFIRQVVANRNSIEFTGYSAEEMLARRIVAYAAGSTDSTPTLPADDMMKFIVTQNLGSGAAAARQLTGLAVEAYTSQAASVTKAFAHSNVMSILTELREITRQDGTEVFFKFTPDGSGGWVFRTYAGQVGLDRTQNALHLSESNENFILDAIGFDANEEVTYMYVGGAGVEAARLIGTAENTARVVLSAYNRREAFYNSSQEKTQASVDFTASQELSRRRARRIFSGTIVERPDYRYGIEWDLGDILTAEQDGRAYTVMVRKVGIKIDETGETIAAQVEVQ